MAPTQITDVFRFVALRPPDTADEDDPVTAPLRDRRKPEGTAVGRTVAELGQRPSRGKLNELLRRRAREEGIVPEPPTDGPGSELAAVARAMRAATRDPAAASAIVATVTQLLGTDPKAYLADQRNATVRDQLWDRLEVHYLLVREAPRDLDPIVEALRALRLVEVLADGHDVANPESLAGIIEATLVLPSVAAEAEPEKRSPSRRSEAQAKVDAARRAEYERVWTEFLELNQAAATLRTARFEAKATRVEKPDRPVTGRPDPERPEPGQPEQPERPERPGGQIPSRLVSPSIRIEETVRRILPRATLDKLPQAAKRVVDELPLGGSLSDKPLLTEALQTRLSAVADRILSSTDPLMFEAMPAEAAELPGMQALSAKYTAKPALELDYPVGMIPFPWVVRPVIRPLGIGDLKVVKQTLQRYVAGEVAHIENVLDGEKKERNHRRLDRTEQTFTIETETVEETERDNQTTDRFELKKESEKTITEDMKVDAGITVSASYGPVELGAYANFAYSQSSTETTKNSQNFARDVVDRSVTKIQKRAREERVTKTIKEIEESNLHGIDNSPAGNGHVTGIYRWVDKHYEAQVYNYGKRMMFEFIVPEPAAYYYYSQENDPSNKIAVEKPVDLALLSHKDVQPWNFGAYVRAYNVQGVTPPPPQWRVMTATFDQNGMTDDQTTSKSSKELIVPDGYIARSWGFTWSAWVGEDVYRRVLVGLESSSGSSFDLDGEDAVVPVSIVTNDVRAFATNVEVFCERTDRAFELWQIQTFEKIVSSYQAAKAAYEDKVKAAEVARGIIIEGRNPGQNQHIIRNELKKQSITLFTGEDYSSFNSVSGTPPVLDLHEAAEEAPFIQFFEQAFEWEQLTYLFYPYFWSRTSTWNKRLGFDDPDPMFNQFLQAGAVRVVVPVHPAYNEAVLHFVETGVLWNGGTPPHLDDPLFVSIVEELKAQTDDLDGAVAEGEPWKVVVPTSLVYLQADAALPDFTV